MKLFTFVTIFGGVDAEFEIHLTI